VGRDLKRLQPRPVNPGEARLKVQGLKAMGDRGAESLHGIDLEIHSGEILGLAGVSGNGQRELAQCLAGMRKATAGRILIGEQDITNSNLNQRVAAGMAYIPEERMRDGAIREFSVEENIYLHDHSAPQYTRGVFLNFASMQSHAVDLVREFTVKTPSLETPLKNLSGGNIQKLIMARELSRKPGVLVAAQPTRGVDIGATEYIHQRLLAQREAGTAILLISEDLDEILALSDRVAVIYEGRIMEIIPRQEAVSEKIGLLMAGVSADEPAAAK